MTRSTPQTFEEWWHGTGSAGLHGGDPAYVTIRSFAESAFAAGVASQRPMYQSLLSQLDEKEAEIERFKKHHAAAEFEFQEADRVREQYKSLQAQLAEAKAEIEQGKVLLQIAALTIKQREAVVDAARDAMDESQPQGQERSDGSFETRGIVLRPVDALRLRAALAGLKVGDPYEQGGIDDQEVNAGDQ